jgi:hypothetical protein
MKCLSYAEGKKLLYSLGHISENVADKTGTHSLPRFDFNLNVSAIPLSAFRLSFFAARIRDLLSPGDVVLWLTQWGDTLPEHYYLFEHARRGLRETRTVKESPVHLFSSSNVDDREAISAFLFLVLSFEWGAYLFSSNASEIIFVQDGSIAFSLPDQIRHRQVRDLLAEFRLS